MREDATGKLQPADNPFKITAAVQDIDDIAKAIAAEPFIAQRKPTGPLNSFLLTASSEWEKMQPSQWVEANTEATSYGFLVPH